MKSTSFLLFLVLFFAVKLHAQSSGDSLASLEKQYSTFIQQGDEGYSKGDWQASMNFYTQALNVKPDEKYPKERILICSERYNAINENEKRYNALIAQGDIFFCTTNADFSAVKSFYQQACAIKPNENYPKAQIARCDLYIKDAAEKKAIEAKYNDAIAKGDAAFTAKKWIVAKKQYAQALMLKPDQQYPKDRLLQIDQIFSAESDTLLKAEIGRQSTESGDSLFYLKDYSNAAGWYHSALSAGIKDVNVKKNAFICDSIVKSNEEYLKKHPATQYYPDGTKWKEWQMLSNDSTLYSEYFRNGVMHKRGFIVHGQNSGEWKSYDCNNVLAAIYHYKNNKFDGVCKYYYSSGKIYETENYKDGMSDGATILYDTLGHIKEITIYKSGKRNGEHILYFSNGNKSLTETYRDDQLQGKQCEYYENGNKKHERTYLNNQYDGLETEYYENGKMSHYAKWRTGEFIKESEKWWDENGKAFIPQKQY